MVPSIASGEMVPDVPAGAGDLNEPPMPRPRSGMKPVRDGSEIGGIVHAMDATFIPQVLERPKVILWAFLSTCESKSKRFHLMLIGQSVKLIGIGFQIQRCLNLPVLESPRLQEPCLPGAFPVRARRRRAESLAPRGGRQHNPVAFGLCQRRVD